MLTAHRRLAVPLTILVIYGLAGTIGLSADDWMRPEPASFHSRGMQLVAEIFPPASRQNQGTHALCYFYELGYPGTRWDVTPTLKWKAELANEHMPVEAIVSQDGWLVTLNEWYGAGQAHSLVVYDPRGRLVADWSGDRLFADPALRKIARDRMSMSSVWWNQHANYYFTRQRAVRECVGRCGDSASIWPPDRIGSARRRRFATTGRRRRCERPHGNLEDLAPVLVDH